MKHRVLSQADNIIHGARQYEYGQAEHSFETIAALWSTYLGYKVTAEQVAMCMILLKVGRCKKNSQFDSLVDICGYAALIDTIKHGDNHGDNHVAEHDDDLIV